MHDKFFLISQDHWDGQILVYLQAEGIRTFPLKTLATGER